MKYYKLNYIRVIPNEKDFPFRHVMGLTAPKPLPESVDLTKDKFYPRVYDQGSQGSCTSAAACGVKEYITKKYVPLYPKPSMDGFYYCEREANGDTGIDAGSDGRTSAEVMMKVGVGSEKLWPYTDAHLLQKPSEAYYIEANKNKIGAFYFIKTPYELMKCLNDKYPVIFGTYVPKQMMADDFDGHLPVCALSDIVMEDGVPSGHQMSIFGYRKIDGKWYALVRNSWNTDYAMGGHLLYPFEMLFDSNWVDALITYRLANEKEL